MQRLVKSRTVRDDISEEPWSANIIQQTATKGEQSQLDGITSVLVVANQGTLLEGVLNQDKLLYKKNPWMTTLLNWMHQQHFQ